MLYLTSPVRGGWGCVPELAPVAAFPLIPASIDRTNITFTLKKKAGVLDVNAMGRAKTAKLEPA